MEREAINFGKSSSRVMIIKISGGRVATDKANRRGHAACEQWPCIFPALDEGRSSVRGHNGGKATSTHEIVVVVTAQ